MKYHSISVLALNIFYLIDYQLDDIFKKFIRLIITNLNDENNNTILFSVISFRERPFENNF